MYSRLITDRNPTRFDGTTSSRQEVKFHRTSETPEQAGQPWPSDIDPVVRGDQILVFAHKTPAVGVVLTPMTNFGTHGRDEGRVTVNSSVGMWRKLERLMQEPKVAIAFHARDHSACTRADYVMVQGDGAVSPTDEPDRWMNYLGSSWETFGGQPRDVGLLWERWLRAYHWRVNVDVAVHRVLSWNNLECGGSMTVVGPPVAGPPRSQQEPKGGVAPRVNVARLGSRMARLPHVLLGWVGSDGYPVVTSVRVSCATKDGLRLEDLSGQVPAGARRAGLIAHSFSKHVVGQNQRKLTGWLTVQDGNLTYAPHTQHGYWLPPSRFAYNLGAGFVTRRGLRSARRAGFVASSSSSSRTRGITSRR
jgi:hypothetical protein